jgi:hypothetical protein
MKKNILTIMIATAIMLVASASYASGKKASITEKGYTVHSVIDGRESTTAYNKKGNWIYTIQNYSTDNLDKNIIDKVQTSYNNYGVTAIQKIEQPGADAVYVVNLENNTSIKIVRVTNDGVELIKDLTKE